MNLREHAVLDVINIASTISRWPDFWCTSQEMVDVLYDDDPYDRFLDERKVLGDRMTAKRFGYIIRNMVKDWPTRRAPLVRKRRVQGVNQWQMTEAGLTAVCA